jgi:hypothetical protein
MTDKELLQLALDALELAQDNLRPHGDNCFLHDDGEYNRCFCGKDSLFDHLQSVVENLDTALRQALEPADDVRHLKETPPCQTGSQCTSKCQICQALEQADEPVVVDGNTSDGYHTFNELYEFRKAYNAALFNELAAGGKCSVHKSWRHHDGELCFGGGWFIVVAILPDGQISNHYEAKDWDLFAIPETAKALFEFDGHTGADVLNRLKAYRPQPAAHPDEFKCPYCYDQPADEPVAWMDGKCIFHDEDKPIPMDYLFWTPLYTRPQPAIQAPPEAQTEAEKTA